MADTTSWRPNNTDLSGKPVGLNSHTRLAELRRLAELGGAIAPFRRLEVLAAYDPLQLRTAKSVGAYIYFITRPEISTILEEWAAENAHAYELLTLSACLGGRTDLIRPLRPFDESKRASAALRGTVADEPLNALVAERRAVVPDNALAHWIEQLRVLSLLRGLELLGVGARTDRHHTKVCDAARKACERDSSEQLNWMRLVTSPSTHLADFEADLVYRCDVAIAKGQRKDGDRLSESGRGFLRALRRLVAGGTWWDPRSLRDGPRVEPMPLAAAAPRSGGVQSELGLEGSLDEDSNDVVTRPTGADPDSRFISQKVKRGTTQSQIREHGGKILLSNIEDHLHLAPSWHQLSVHESDALASRIRYLLQSPSAVDRVGAALTLVAWVSARGMFDIETVRLSADLDVDWSLDPATNTMRRLPPRFARRVRAGSLGKQAQGWLYPLADSLEVALCGNAAAALRITEASVQSPVNVAELWRTVSLDVTLDNWYSNVLANTPELKRLSGPAMAHALASKVFHDTADSTLSQLLASQGRTALPAASAYAAYRLSEVQQTLRAAFPQDLCAIPPVPADAALTNAAGSELDIDLARVAHAIEGLTADYEAAAGDPQRWVEAHNLLTSIVVLSLLATTGARPVNSPFETLSWFDFQRLLMYVEDKRAGPTSGARICVLAQAAAALLQNVYLPHLESLATLLAPTCPLMAEAIRRSLSSDSDQDRPLPFLFYLRSAPDFGWLEVTETQLGVHYGSAWAVPWNFFRHVLATQLIRRAVHPEIVDALLSHGDRGAESHGDHSLRVPREDIEAARPAVEDLHRDLGFRCPDCRPSLPAHLRSAYPDLKADETPPFGRKARATARDKLHAAARERATRDIERLVGGRAPNKLSAADWQTIGKCMLFNGTMPHPAASLRYAAFEEWLEATWHQKRALVAVKRRYSPLEPPLPLFTADFIVAEGALERALHAFRRATSSVDLNGDRAPGPMLAAVLGAIELVLTSRVAHVQTLLDLVHLRRNLRLVRFDGTFWLERANADLWEDGRPVMRIPLSARAARWIALALASPRRGVKDAPVPSLLQSWIDEHLKPSNTLRAAFGRLCSLQQQVNAWNCTGVEAAHLSARRVVTALPHHDWYRLCRSAAPVLSEPAPEVGEHEDEDSSFEVPVGKRDADVLTQGTAQRCATLLDGITQAFRKMADAADILAEIRRLTAKSGFQKGDAPQVLAHFACVLLTRKRRTGKKVRLRLQTARRYWYSLVGPFVDLAHDRFLPDEDEESIREFYEDIVHWWEAHPEPESPSPEGSVQPKPEADSAEEREAAQHHDAMIRTVAQLKDFHDFAVKAYGIEDVDWSGVELGSKLAVGRPALILLSEVEVALAALVGGQSPSELADERLSAAFVLVACARFGLRVSEAVGMYRDDWLDWSGAVVLLVRANAVRSLKTKHGRRQVPLVETLTARERDVIDETLRRWELTHKAGASAPLLPGVDKETYWSVKAAVSEQLLRVLKAVTRSSAARIHGLRHSFACRLLALLVGRELGPGLPVDAEATQHVRRLLLGRDDLDRRATWAIARALGHSNCSVGLGCYIHGIELWAKPFGAFAEWDGWGVQPSAFINLETLETDPGYGAPIDLKPAPSLPAASLPLRRIRFLSLVQAGHRPDRAHTTAGLGTDELKELLSKLRLMPDEASAATDAVPGASILSSISFIRWQALSRLVGTASAGVVAHRPGDPLGAPVGPRRHLILHRPHHFQAAAEFITLLGLGTSDVRLVTAKGLHADKLRWIEESGLSGYVVAAESLGKDFRLDPVEWGDPPEPVTHRAILTPSGAEGRKVASTQELLVLWVVTHSAVAGT
jgi:site-specific recombinase XerD